MKSILSRRALLLAGAGAVALPRVALGATPRTKPNIIVIYADDLG